MKGLRLWLYLTPQMVLFYAKKQEEKKDPDFALLCLEEYLANRKRIKNSQKGEILYRICYLYSIIGNVETSLKKYCQLLKFSKEHDFDIIGIIANMIDCYNNSGLYEEAIKFYSEEFETLEDRSSVKLYPYLYYNIGNSFYNIKNYKQALTCYKKYQTIAPENKLNNTFFNMALCYYKLNSLDLAYNCLKEALKYASTPFEKGETLYSLGVIEYDKKNNAKAKEYFGQASDFGYSPARNACEEVKIKIDEKKTVSQKIIQKN